MVTAERHPGSHYHGKDGLEDAPDPSAPGTDQIQTEHGVNALVRLSQEHTGIPLTQVCVLFSYRRVLTSHLITLKI